MKLFGSPYVFAGVTVAKGGEVPSKFSTMRFPYRPHGRGGHASLHGIQNCFASRLNKETTMLLSFDPMPQDLPVLTVSGRHETALSLRGGAAENESTSTGGPVSDEDSARNMVNFFMALPIVFLFVAAFGPQIGELTVSDVLTIYALCHLPEALRRLSEIVKNYHDEEEHVRKKPDIQSKSKAALSLRGGASEKKPKDALWLLFICYGLLRLFDRMDALINVMPPFMDLDKIPKYVRAESGHRRGPLPGKNRFYVILGLFGGCPLSDNDAIDAITIAWALAYLIQKKREKLAESSSQRLAT